MEPRKAEDIRNFEIVLPQSINNHGTIFGGKLLELMDKTAAIAALRFGGRPMATARFHEIDLHAPIRQGNILEICARVIHAGQTSVIVKVKVLAQPRTGGPQTLTTSGYLVFVGVDEAGEPAPVPPLERTTDQELKDWDIGESIRAAYQRRNS